MATKPSGTCSEQKGAAASSVSHESGTMTALPRYWWHSHGRVDKANKPGPLCTVVWCSRTARSPRNLILWSLSVPTLASTTARTVTPVLHPMCRYNTSAVLASCDWKCRKATDSGMDGAPSACAEICLRNRSSSSEKMRTVRSSRPTAMKDALTRPSGTGAIAMQVIFCPTSTERFSCMAPWPPVPVSSSTWILLLAVATTHWLSLEAPIVKDDVAGAANSCRMRPRM
mmetsp:Transcript_35305/g.87716  ORF Transcript_35305/g.87716 Transcript_35305/m.87716 type:complete len:228 (+) Transcript_35305:1700-2383(+)